MEDWIGWLVFAGIVVIFELFTGTFYLLMIAIGLLAGGLMAFFGLSRELQYLVAAIVGIVATYALRRSRYGKSHKVDPSRDPNVNLDIGETLHIKEWNSSEGDASTARVMYRGAMWDVQLASGATAQSGSFVIQEMRGSKLIVSNHNVNN